MAAISPEQMVRNKKQHRPRSILLLKNTANMEKMLHIKKLNGGSPYYRLIY
jgi:hypothetical protein